MNRKADSRWMIDLTAVFAMSEVSIDEKAACFLFRGYLQAE